MERNMKEVILQFDTARIFFAEEEEEEEEASIVVSLKDITERKKAEKELRESEEKFRGLFESNPEALVYIDKDFKIVDINPRFEELFGYSIDEIKGRYLNDLIVPENKKDEAQKLDETAKKGYTFHETVRKKKDGTLVPVSISAAPVISEGSIVGINVIYKDITHRKLLEQQREKARKEAEFYSDLLGHDIGNLDQVILGYLYLLENAKDEETRKRNIEGIKKSIMKSKRLAESIKILKKIKDTKIERFYLNKSLERSIKEIKEYFDREIEVNLDIDKRYYVKANDFLDKVFFNILENSVEYTFHDPVFIDIKIEERNGFCNVHIRDYGIGISKKKREDILKNLETLSKRTGMGFYLIKKILDRFNGKFEIKDVKKGTEIVVSIPVVK